MLRMRFSAHNVPKDNRWIFTLFIIHVINGKHWQNNNNTFDNIVTIEEKPTCIYDSSANGIEKIIYLYGFYIEYNVWNGEYTSFVSLLPHILFSLLYLLWLLLLLFPLICLPQQCLKREQPPKWHLILEVRYLSRDYRAMSLDNDDFAGDVCVCYSNPAILHIIRHCM